MDTLALAVRRWSLTGHVAALAPIEALLLGLLRKRDAAAPEGRHARRRLSGFGLVAAAAGDEHADEGVEGDHDDEEDGVRDGEEGLSWETCWSVAASVKVGGGDGVYQQT